MFVFIITQMEIRNNLLHLSRVMTRPVQYTYNRCQFVTRSWFIYAIRCARLLLPGFPLPTYSSNKNCTFIHFFTCTIIWFTGENVLSAANFKFFLFEFFQTLTFSIYRFMFFTKKIYCTKMLKLRSKHLYNLTEVIRNWFAMRTRVINHSKNLNNWKQIKEQ